MTKLARIEAQKAQAVANMARVILKVSDQLDRIEKKLDAQAKAEKKANAQSGRGKSEDKPEAVKPEQDEANEAAEPSK